MIWRGQYTAILALIFIAGVVVSFIMESVEPGFAALTFVILAHVGVGVINLLFRAFLGRPLVYDVKIMSDDRGAKED